MSAVETARAAGNAAITAAAIIATVIAALMFVPGLLGLDRYVITGGSMSGTFERGALVFERQVPVSDLRVGDIITYLPPSESGLTELVTHRIVSIEPGLTANADAGLTRIALANLLDNAWKFTSQSPDAHIEVASTLVEGRAGFVVRDNGAGFDTAHADNLFAPFQRLHGEAEFPGTGIGLAIVQRIVHRHGGALAVEASPGRGATFRFTLGA